MIRAAGECAQRVEVCHVFPDAPSTVEPRAMTFQEATRQFHAQLLRQALEDSAWNISDVARRLDLAGSHVYSLIRAYGLTRDPR